MGAFWLCFVGYHFDCSHSHFIPADEQEDDFPGRVGSSLLLSKSVGDLLDCISFVSVILKSVWMNICPGRRGGERGIASLVRGRRQYHRTNPSCHNTELHILV